MKFITSQVRWGIIGAGHVCEMKSGPAFSKAPNSKLIAVMRRNLEKAKDYARRHNVPKYYNDAEKLINDPDINAIYIATPPVYHEEYAIMAMKTGKPVYIEKPLTLNSKGCERLIKAEKKYQVPASGAYYRRALPLYVKVKYYLQEHAIGRVRLIGIKLFQSPANHLIADSKNYWRVNPAISGGGLFHDLAPHQLDIMYWFFGMPSNLYGLSMNQGKACKAPDVTSLEMIFNENIIFSGLWSFNVHESAEEDSCEIIGKEGMINFPFFHAPILQVDTRKGLDIHPYANPPHIQQPFIEKVVQYFRGQGPNPCPLEEILHSMKMMDATL